MNSPVFIVRHLSPSGHVEAVRCFDSLSAALDCIRVNASFCLYLEHRFILEVIA